MTPGSPLQILLRLLVTALASGILGANRTERGRAAGMKTTVLVGLAAAVAMVLASELLTLRGKAADSFVNADVMRLPLGILTGMGFIGAASVFHRDDLVVGVTTAATLWFVSVIGLCFGAGRMLLGGMSFGLCLAILSLGKRIEDHLRRDHHGTLALRVSPAGPSDEALRERLRAAGLSFDRWSLRFGGGGASPRAIRCEVRWRAGPSDGAPPHVVEQLASLPGVEEVGWET
ncbi:MAG: MgtC/SapB family protein [Polyangiaceae bacterium]